ncbi:MAG: hypothetical protein HC830_14990 [Bacteroidetes bacterium]|nr:hypothetical protein [Bacteroidota bacterium]
MNDTNFVDGGMTNSSPVLLAHISDENGINTTGSGIGHDLVAGLDNIPTENYILNDYFEGDWTVIKRKGILPVKRVGRRLSYHLC